MSVTIKDIAKIAGVSHTTVSRALNDSPLIKEETKKAIKHIAKTMAYVPDRNARALVTANSNNIGLFFSSITVGTSASFFQEVVAGVSKEIHNKYNLVINAIDTYKNYNEINNRSYDGIILVSQTQKDDFFIADMVKKKMPIVVVNRNIRDFKVTNVLSDDEVGVYEGVSHLINHGYKEIGLIEGEKGYESSKLRKAGYLRAMADMKVSVIDDYIVPGNYTMGGGYDAMKSLLKLPKYPKAVFCCNDDMAFGATKAIQEAGLEIPKDIAIMGFDNSLFAQYMNPPLTTIKRPIADISGKGTKLLLEQINNRDAKVKTIYQPSSLIIRKSI